MLRIRKVLFALWMLMVCGFVIANDFNTRVKSYDTTYTDVKDSTIKWRQIYVNDEVAKTETYILHKIVSDSVVKKWRWDDPYLK